MSDGAEKAIIKAGMKRYQRPMATETGPTTSEIRKAASRNLTPGISSFSTNFVVVYRYG